MQLNYFNKFAESLITINRKLLDENDSLICLSSPATTAANASTSDTDAARTRQLLPPDRTTKDAFAS